MGKSSEEIAASSGGSEVSGLGSCKAHDVSVGAEEDRGGTKGTVGEDTGAGEESGLATWGACCGEFAAGSR
ncbi:MAG TPA: hypothetical protein VIH78_16590 [Terriglobales bacterium]